MTSELVFTVEGSAATPAQAVSLADAGLRERDDLQEWVLAHPSILGADVKIVSFEFDRWEASVTGDRQLDRLDVLGLDREGRLVVAELKRDRAPDTAQMQAVKYAAMASRFTEETLVQHYVAFRARRQQPIDDEVARAELVEHAGGELDTELLRRPRIVLVAGSFPPAVTASAVWLTEMGLDITIQRVQAYRVFGDKIVVTVSTLFPLADVEEFTVSPQRAQVQAVQERRRQGREKSTVLKLVASRVIPDGTRLQLRPTSDVDPATRALIDEWVAADPRRGWAVWHNRRKDPLEWEYDGASYRPTPIVARIIKEAADLDRSPRGPAWWALPDGRDLTQVAGFVAAAKAFDWSGLHALMTAIPPGRWSTYGDLAALIGTAAQPLGGHIAACTECPNAHRVLGSEGRVRPNFAWTDLTDTRSPQQVLESEGLVFSSSGAAAADARLSAAELDEIFLSLADAD